MGKIDHAMSIASRYAKGGAVENQPTKMPHNLRAQETENPIRIKTLANAFDTAIARHTALPHEQRIASSKAADDIIAQYMGRYSTTSKETGAKKGQSINLLSKNTKLAKGEGTVKGYEPIKLPDGRGVEYAGLALAPAYQHGAFNTCPNSASCKKECLGKTSGGYWTYGGASNLEEMKGPRLQGLQRLMALVHSPEAFAVKMHDEIASKKHEAHKNGNMLAIRPNVISDIHPRVYKAIMEAHPDVSFYDYTKNNLDPVAPNHHLTYSSTGLSQPAGLNGNETDVHNPHQNWKNIRKRLDTGSNAAMAFSMKQNKAHTAKLPEQLHDKETGKTYKIVDGDTHDYRPLDQQPHGHPGVIVGLRNKNQGSKQASAHVSSHGFMVHHDPEQGGTVFAAHQTDAPQNVDNDSKPTKIAAGPG